MTTWTVLDEQAVHTVDGPDGPTPAIDPAAFGWDRKPEGLCRGDVCIPVPAGTPSGPLEATLLGRLLGRPVVIDADEHVVAFGASAADRAEALRSGQAPDFALADLDGTVHHLSDYRGRKVVLYAYGSW